MFDRCSSGCLVLLIGICLVHFACSAPALPEMVDERQAAISGGERVPAGAWPMVVWLDNGCSGVLVSEDLVIYAGHCGATVSEVWLGSEIATTIDDESMELTVLGGSGTTSLPVRSCRVHPDGTLGSGKDIAFCELAAHALEMPFIVGMLPCREVHAGDVATLVGYGEDASGGPPGTKRAVQAVVISVGSEIRIGDIERGTCPGDSGGPAFVVTNADSQPEWALVGVLSSGLVGDGCGTGYYTSLDAVLPWLESESGRDLTPCSGNDGSWSPSPRCTRPKIDAGGQPIRDSDREVFSEVCGPAFDPEPPDIFPPEITHIERVADGESLHVVVSAQDRGWGVRSVRLQALDRHGDILHDERTEHEPYIFELSRHGGSVVSLLVTATDYAGLMHDVRVPLEVSPSSSCRIAIPSQNGGGFLPLSFVLCATFLRRQRLHRATRCTRCTPHPRIF